MTLQPITYRGRTVAACTRTRMFFSDELEASGAQDPPQQFVVAMCLYAGEVLNGHRPGPYRDEDARAYARALLIPRELLEAPRPVPTPNFERVAFELGVPLQELFLEFSRELARRRRVERRPCEARAR